MIPAPSPFADKVRREPELREVSPRLRITHIKLFADGALGSRGAALSQPYADDPDMLGVFRMTQDELKDEVQRTLAAGLDVATHAIGDAAVTRVLDVYESVLAAEPALRPRRLRIEHISYATTADLERAARLGVLLVIQPGFVYPEPNGRTMEDARLGEKRSANAYAWKRLEKLEAVMAGSSDDFNVPLHPLWNFYAAITRKNPAGRPARGWHPAERLDREAGLKLFTSFFPPGGAEASSGKLEKGSPADLAVLSANPLSVEEAKILSIKVQVTLLEGRVTFGGEEW
jgi:predicted amidohydrolase YtcJ